MADGGADMMGVSAGVCSAIFGNRKVLVEK
jgi:hypothetical protein